MLDYCEKVAVRAHPRSAVSEITRATATEPLARRAVVRANTVIIALAFRTARMPSERVAGTATVARVFPASMARAYVFLEGTVVRTLTVAWEYAALGSAAPNASSCRGGT